MGEALIGVALLRESGFRMPAIMIKPRAPAIGVRKAPGTKSRCELMRRRDGKEAVRWHRRFG
jgi:hypothetical protein